MVEENTDPNVKHCISTKFSELLSRNFHETYQSAYSEFENSWALSKKSRYKNLMMIS